MVGWIVYQLWDLVEPQLQRQTNVSSLVGILWLLHPAQLKGSGLLCCYRQRPNSQVKLGRICYHKGEYLLGTFSKNKQHCIDDIGFSTAVGTHNGWEALQEKCYIRSQVLTYTVVLLTMRCVTSSLHNSVHHSKRNMSAMCPKQCYPWRESVLSYLVAHLPYEMDPLAELLHSS